MAALVRWKFRFIEAERGTGFPPKMTWSAKSKDSQVKATLKKKLKFEWQNTKSKWENQVPKQRIGVEIT